jgi:DHA1 family bicyclomycin/chloramphenicol resistance-like MFS transporter
MSDRSEIADAPGPAVPHPGMGFREFVAIIALMMAVNALAIDSMLPALPEIGDALGVVEANERQYIITAYLLGFGVAQLLYGPLSDRYGRKWPLIIGLVIFAIFSAVSAIATSFDTMLFARVMQGVGAASTRVLAVSIVRDCYSGRRMARVMSLSFIVFIAVPVVAPSIGQAIVLFAPWNWIFGVLGLFAAVITVWIFLRLPETLSDDRRQPLSPAGILASFRIVLTNRVAVGYTLASAVILGGLFGFINSAQQIFVEVFELGTAFPLVFSGIAIFIAISSYTNSKIVERLGMRVVSHTAMFGFAGFATVHAVVAGTGHESLWSFVVLQSGMMFCFGLVMSNFGSMAMDPVGRVAGTASSVQGFVTTLVGALLGFYIGQHYDGTAFPLTLGYSVLGWLAIVIVFITEGGRLFHSVNVQPAE